MKKETQFIHMARPKPGLGTAVNPSISRASTLLFDRAEDLYRNDIRGYGRHGSAVHDAVEDSFTALEGGAGTTLAPSGLAACTLAILACVKAGDHILLTDSSYGPTRYFSQTFLKDMNIEMELYKPRIGGDIEALIRDNTALICMEVPGSLSFEIQDVSAIVAVAKSRNIKTMIDNTWSAGLCFSPIAMGVDISVHAATKYFCGHSDVLFGAAIARTQTMQKALNARKKQLGYATSPDDAYQILRGFRTVVPRFNKQAETALHLAQWLSGHPLVKTVLHPALPEHPDHNLWQQDFTGTGCLFSCVLNPCPEDTVLAFINALTFFGIGYSYGGFESLVIHCDPQLKRHYALNHGGPLVRFACGLESVDDLKTDIEQAFAKVF